MKSAGKGLLAGLVLVVFCVLLAAPAVLAQSTTDGAIGGTITDQSGAIVLTAQVTAKNLGTNSTASATPDSAGRYIIIHLQPGQYLLEVTASGFAKFSQTNVIVEVGRVTSIDVVLGEVDR